MAQNLKDFYKENQTEPVLTTVGRGMRPMTDALQERDRIKKTLPVIAGALANQAPKVLGVPAAGIANAASRGIADFQTGFTGQKYRPQQFEAKSFTDLFGAQKPAIAAPLAAPAASPRPVLDQRPPLAGLNDLSGIAGQKDWSSARPVRTGWEPSQLPSMEQIASDKARANAAQVASGTQMGVQTPGATGINVRKQANGVLEFSGKGGGDGTGAVNYTGLPNWTSVKGGAGQGSADFGGQAFKPAQAAVAAANSPLTKYNEIADKIGRGEGGAVGVAQNKIQLAALAPMIERQMANENATGIAKMDNTTRQRGQDLGLQGEMARTKAAIYGTDVGAQTADADRQVEMDKVRASVLNAKAKAAAGKPLSQVEQLGLQIFEGKAFKTPEARKAAMADYIQMFKGGDPLSQMIAEMMAAQQDGQ